MSNILPAVTLYQPWATWIMRQWKEIETRTHARFACLKGKTILIHAGQTTDNSDLAVKNPYLSLEQIMYDPDDMINGYLLGTARVYDFQPLNASHSKKALIDCEHTQRYGLFLDMVNEFETPIYVKGEMGIWYYDLDNHHKVKKAA